MILKKNNFNLLRLFASIQVLLYHALFHLNLSEGSSFADFLDYVPGVLIFFTISGFLITSSFDRSSDLKRYLKNRLLRIFPALWVCTILTFGLLFAFRVLSVHDFLNIELLAYLFSQLTIFHFWTPDILRPWGCGVPNGSLWTIGVELQFYIILPMLFLFFKQIKLVYKITLMFILSMVFNFYLRTKLGLHETNLTKLLYVSFGPYLYFFLFGSLMYLNWEKLRKYVEGKFLIYLGLYLSFSFYTRITPAYYPSNLELLSNLLLSMLIISAAYSYPKIGSYINEIDLSYGVYLYHMPVINAFITLGLIGNYWYVLGVFLITISVSFSSFYLIEKPALRLKK